MMTTPDTVSSVLMFSVIRGEVLLKPHPMLPLTAAQNAHHRRFVVSCAVPVGNVSWILFQKGRSSNFS